MTKIVKYRPASPLLDVMDPFFGRSLLQDMDQVFEQFFGRPLATSGHNLTFSPQMDIAETATSYELTADLPGLTEDNLDVSVTEGILTIAGERAEQSSTTEGNFTRRERSYGQFSRRFQLPEHVNADGISASFKNGVLHVSLPKTTPTQPAKKPIKINS